MSCSPLADASMPSPPPLTPQLVSAAYRRALRFGAFWRLRPKERALLILSRRLKAIKSPALREALLKIISKVWPEKGLRCSRRTRWA